MLVFTILLVVAVAVVVAVTSGLLVAPDRHPSGPAAWVTDDDRRTTRTVARR